MCGKICFHVSKRFIILEGDLFLFENVVEIRRISSPFFSSDTSLPVLANLWLIPRDGQRVVSQKSNRRESVLHCSHVCRRQREQFLTPNRGKAEPIGWGPRSAVLLPDAFSHMGGSACGATAHDDGHGAVHDTFMTLPAYTRTSEGEVHELGLGVRNCPHRALSDPLSETSESIESGALPRGVPSGSAHGRQLSSEVVSRALLKQRRSTMRLG